MIKYKLRAKRRRQRVSGWVQICRNIDALLRREGFGGLVKTLDSFCCTSPASGVSCHQGTQP